MSRESAPDGMAYLHLFDTAINVEVAYSVLAAQIGPPSREDPRIAVPTASTPSSCC